MQQANDMNFKKEMNQLIFKECSNLEKVGMLGDSCKISVTEQCMTLKVRGQTRHVERVDLGANRNNHDVVGNIN